MDCIHSLTGAKRLLSTIDQFYLLLAFVVPGFVLHSVRAVFILSRAQSADMNLLRFMTLSAINYAVASPLIYLLVTADASDPKLLTSIGWFGVLLVCPAALGVLWTFSEKKGLLRSLLNRIKLTPINPVPTGWDWQFGRMEDPHWILVTLTDGSQVAGYFGGESMASSDPEERDVFIELVYQIPSGGGAWIPCKDSKGILISKDRISHIEFRSC